MWKVQVDEMMIKKDVLFLFGFHLVIDGSFCQPLESTRLTRTTNVRKRFDDFI
jgi:hypothetical protein